MRSTQQALKSTHAAATVRSATLTGFDQTQRVLAWRTAALLTVLGLMALLAATALGSLTPAITAVAVVGLLVSAISIVLVRTQLPIAVSVWCLIGSWFGAVVVISYLRGGISAPPMIVLPIMPIIVATLIGPYAAWLAFSLIALLLGVFLGLHLVGHEFAQAVTDDPWVLLMRTVWLGLTALVATVMAAYHAAQSRDLTLQLLQQASTDLLTGVASRRAVESALTAEAARARRHETWLTVLMIDVDYFKRVNDGSGHAAGDACLIKVADALRQCIRMAGDVVGRWGGEEFVVVLPTTGCDGARITAERLRQSVADMRIPYQADSDEYVTVTVGVACQRGDQLVTSEQLVKLADDALYAGKERGRNCVVMAPLASEEHVQASDPSSTQDALQR